ncbi:MAG TPA: tyrosine-type recombinase/integrase [Holophagaceae bacterium]|nr:tyrosine-type recombinase/integrase [Holophagaceae bacterium]
MTPTRPSRVAKLTQRTVEALKPEAVPYYAWDSELKGFGVRVMPSGRKAWVAKYRVKNSSQAGWETIGRCELKKADEARANALEVLAQAASGKNPKAPKVDRLTVAGLVEKFRKIHMPTLAPSTFVQYNRRFEANILPALGKRLVAEITTADIEKLHSGIKAPMTGNRVLALLSKLFREAERWKIREPFTNPVRDVLRPPEKSRKRFLSTDEIGRLVEALNQLEVEFEGVSDSLAGIEALRLLMYTGCRHQEIVRLRWDQVDLERDEIQFRREHKTGRTTGEKSLPLLPEARKIIERQPRLLNNPYVFPGRKLGKPLCKIHLMWVKARTKAGLDDVPGKDRPRIHDLRHTFASVLLEADVSIQVLSKLLGHSKIQTTQVYAHSVMATLRKGAEQGVALLEQKMTSKKV